MKRKNFISLRDMSRSELMSLIKKAVEIKTNPKRYSNTLKGKNLLMLFEAVSVRTRLSFEMGMLQLGGHAAYYNISESTLGKKESVEDFARVVSRYVDCIMARVYYHDNIIKLAGSATVPVINGMTNFSHPCQILSDLMTIYEKKGLNRIKLAYLGDGFNNVTHSLLYGCSKMGINISVASPKQFLPDKNVSIDSIKFAKAAGSIVEITSNPKEAVAGADIVYTDSWMSYRIPKDQEKSRSKIFMPYQVNRKLMSFAKKDAIFMHCLPAARDSEITSDVLDSKSSVVFDQAENRMHAQKALLLWLMK
jgi:ornithine carbamoyltransferase